MAGESLSDMVTEARELSSFVLDTYRGRGQPKIQMKMAGLLRRLATKAEDRARAESSPGLIDRVEAVEAESQDLRNQMHDFGFKARKFTPSDQLRAKLATETDRADAAEKRIADALEYAGRHFFDWGERAERVHEILTSEATP